MKIAIPLAAGRLTMHFGQCEEFAPVNMDEETRQVTKTITLRPPAHEPGVLPRWPHEQNATGIIAGGMGQRARQLFVQNGIEVIVGASAQSPDELIQACIQGSLQTGENLCDH